MNSTVEKRIIRGFNPRRKGLINSLSKAICKGTFVLLLASICPDLLAQDLTIVNGGQTGSSGTNWSISGTTLTAAGTASIDASVIEMALSNDVLTIVAANITVSESINSSTANALTFKASANIFINETYDIKTNGGNLILWSNSDNLNGGNVLTGQSVTLDSRQGSASAGGGHIHIGGGEDTNNDGFPDDATAGIGNSSGGAAYGILFGDSADSGVQLLSGGGNITLIGGVDGSFTAAANAHGIGFFPGYTINANAGNITFNGYANSGGATTIGIDLMTFGATNASSITTTGNLTLYGESTVTENTNLGIILNNGLTINAGTVNITGDSDEAGVLLNTSITSGGSMTLRSNTYGFGSASILGQGTLTIEPLIDSNSFNGTFNTSGLTLGSGLTGLTIGKSINTANVTISNTVDISGPITVYCSTTTLNADLTTANGGDITLYTDNSLGGLSSVRNITADGAFKLIPNSIGFTSNISYPITNLNVSSNGLTIGKAGNTSDITISSDLTTSGPVAILGNALALDSNIDCTDMELEGAATLAVGKYINASGNLTNNATLILTSDSNEFARLKIGGTVSGSGTYKYQRWVAGSSTNDLISAPFTGETFGSLVANNSGVLRTNPNDLTQYLFGPFDNDNGVYQTYFSTTNASTTLNAGEGYRAGTTSGVVLEFTGDYQTTDQTTPINVGSHNTYGKWNLVGNPFPTYLDLQGFIQDNQAILEDVNTAVYAYDGDGTDGSNWYIYHLSNSSGVKIAPGQAFFVASSSSGGNLKFNKTRQSITGGDDFLPRLLKTPGIHAVVDLKNADQVTSTDLYISTNGSNGLDPGHDVGTYANESSDFSLYTKLADGNYQDTKFAVQTIANDRSQTVVIPLGVHLNAGTGYSIALDDNTLLELVHIYLKDNVTGSFTLLNNGAYTFDSEVDLEGALRFELHLGDNVTLSTGSQELITPFKTVYKNDAVLLVGFFEINDRIEIYDMMGRLIQVYIPQQNGFGSFKISDHGKSSGIYISLIKREGTYQTLKFLID